MRLHAATRDEVADGLTARYGADPADWTGLRGGLAYDTLAARLDHPVYPTARGRSGLTEEPTAGLRTGVPPAVRAALARPAPGGGHRADRAALPGRLAHARRARPARTSTARHRRAARPPADRRRAPARRAARRRARGPGGARRPAVPRRRADPVDAYRRARPPTPPLHLKLPLATATLGLRNRRTDQARHARRRRRRTAAAGGGDRPRAPLPGQRPARRRDGYAHAGHELLAVLCRRYPAGLDDAVVVPHGRAAAPRRPADGWSSTTSPTASTAATRSPCSTPASPCCSTGRPRSSATASPWSRTSRTSRWCSDRDRGRTRLRLLLKDNDGPRINTRPAARRPLGDGRARTRADFDDAPDLRRPSDAAGRRPVHHHHRPSVRGRLRVRPRPARPRPAAAAAEPRARPAHRGRRPARRPDRGRRRPARTGPGRAASCR